MSASDLRKMLAYTLRRSITSVTFITEHLLVQVAYNSTVSFTPGRNLISVASATKVSMHSVILTPSVPRADISAQI
jgi:hypothetical protein